MAKDDNDSALDSIPHERTEPRPDFSKPLTGGKVPAEIQRNLDSEERFWAIITSGKGEDSTESSVRYAAYATRLRTLLLSAHRYVAYTSDIGESFRPVAHPWLVRGAYGVSWAYLAGDVSHEGYKAYLRNQKILHPETDSKADPSASSTLTALQVPGHVPAIDDYRTVMAQRAVFQGLASMGLPAFTIHSVVRYSGKALRNVKNVRLRTWGPIGLGLGVVPALPYLFDHPVEVATESVFHHAFEFFGGPRAVGKDPSTGMAVRAREQDKDNEKEL